MTLHEAIIEVLKEHSKGLSLSQIASILNKTRTYVKGNGSDIASNQISARVNKYPDLFTKQDGLIFLKVRISERVIQLKPKDLAPQAPTTNETKTIPTDLKSVLASFSQNRFDPKTQSESLVADRAGNYIICLKDGSKLPTVVIKPVMIKFEGLDVIYTGIASISLRIRDYRQHFTGNNAGRSTLRKSLGALFCFKQVPRDKDPNTGKTKFGDVDEQKLSEWMENNLIMFFYPTKDFNRLEIDLIKHFNPPLNLKDNQNSINFEYRRLLSSLRGKKIENMSINDTVESLILYCKENQRICPMPIYWNKLWENLKNRKRVGSAWEPPLPLILAAWYDTPAIMKQLRLIEHIKWAEKQGQLDEISGFLRGLKEEEWFHLDD